MARPEGLRYTKTHEWVKLEDDVATVGITDYAVDQLGDLTFIDLPEPGGKLQAGDTFGEVESTKTVSDLYLPLSGEIVEVNSAIADNLEELSGSPFDAGWLIRIRVDDASHFGSLMDADAYAEHIVAEEAH